MAPNPLHWLTFCELLCYRANEVRVRPRKRGEPDDDQSRVDRRSLGTRSADKVELRGFGSFRIRHRNSRKGRNPKTGTGVDVPQKRVPFFKVGKRLRELVNT